MRGYTRDEARQSVRRQLGRIADVSVTRNRQQAKTRIRGYLGMRTVKLDAAYRVLGGHASNEEANELAGQINLFRPCEPCVAWWREPKRTTGYRPVCDLPSELHAAHLIIADVLQAQFRPRDHLFGTKGGRSRDDLAKSLQAAMESIHTD